LTLPTNELYCNQIQDLIYPVKPFWKVTGVFTASPRRHTMGTAIELKEKVYFDEVYTVLEGIKMKLYILREELAKTYGVDSRMFREHDRHLVEMAEYIDWKRNVLEKGTAFDWKTARGSRTDVESDVSVMPPENIIGPDFSGGYLGG
jgi:hypothetical protein